MSFGTDTPSAIPSQQSEKGFMGKFLNRAWNGIKSGYGKASKWIGDSAVGKAGKWAWKNKVPILNTVGGALQGAGVITGNPAILAAGKGLSVVANGIQEGEAKKALEKVINERQPNPYGNQYVPYSDFPRIHYSRKPLSYKNKGLAEMDNLEAEPRKRRKTRKHKK